MEVEGSAETAVPAFQVNYVILLLIPFLFLITKFLSKSSQWISKWFFQPADMERKRFDDAVMLRTEMKKLSMVDDFAAYSKLQRKLNLVTLGLETDSAARLALRKNLSRTISWVLYAICGGSYLLILATHGTSTPVLILPTTWFFPLNYIFSYPTGVEGGVSILIWTLMTRTFITQFT